MNWIGTGVPPSKELCIIDIPRYIFVLEIGDDRARVSIFHDPMFFKENTDPLVKHIRYIIDIPRYVFVLQMGDTRLPNSLCRRFCIAFWIVHSLLFVKVHDLFGIQIMCLLFGWMCECLLDEIDGKLSEHQGIFKCILELLE
jgi:hypothetical protein